MGSLYRSQHELFFVFKAGTAPHIIQVFEVGTATMMSATGAIKPVYQLMKDANEPFDPTAYLPAITGYYSTSKGDMLSFPFNSSSTVMWINKDALKKANIAEIPKTWPEVFEAACRDAGQRLTLRRQEGYDHGYFFISTFMEDHLRHHAAQLSG